MEGKKALYDILIVDDSKVMRSIVQRTIRQAGFRGLSVAEASNGVEALERLRVEKARVVISDWNMPEMTGFELLRRMQREDFAVPFGFITTAGSLDGMKQLALNSGARFILTKPFSADDVQGALEPILGEV